MSTARDVKAMGKVAVLMGPDSFEGIYNGVIRPVAAVLGELREKHLAYYQANPEAARETALVGDRPAPEDIEPAMMEKFNGLEVSPGSCGWGNFDIMVEVLEGGVGAGPWVMGGRFTAADVLLGSSVNFMRQFGLLGERPVLNAYLERCLARPAYQAALAREGELEDR